MDIQDSEFWKLQFTENKIPTFKKKKKEELRLQLQCTAKKVFFKKISSTISEYISFGFFFARFFFAFCFVFLQ